MAYNGTIDLIAGIRPKNSGTFPLVAAKDVYINDGTRLSDVVFNNNVDELLLQNIIKNTRQEVIYATGTTNITGVRHINTSNVVVRTDTYSVTTNPLVETRTLNTGESLTISTNLTTLVTTITYTPASA